MHAQVLVVGVVICGLAGCGANGDDDPVVMEDKAARMATATQIARVQAAAADVDLALADTTSPFAPAALLDMADPQLTRLELTLAGVDTTGHSSLSDVNLSTYDVDTQVYLMMMMISEDAKRDLLDMLEEMNAVNKQKSALREAIVELQRQESLLVAALRDEYDQRVDLDTNDETESVVDIIPWRITDHYDLAIAPAHLVFETVPGASSASFAFDCGNTQNVTSVRLAVTDVRNDATFSDVLGTTSVNATVAVDEWTAAGVYPSLPKAGQSLTTTVVCSLVINRFRKPSLKQPLDPSRATALRALVALGRKQVGNARAEVDALVKAQMLMFDNAGTLMHALDRVDNQLSHLELGLDDAEGITEEWERQQDTLAELAQEMAERVAMYQERYGQFLMTLTAMMKDVSSTESGIIANLR